MNTGPSQASHKPVFIGSAFAGMARAPE